MKVNLKRIRGPWDQGWALDKHMLKSVYVGDNEAGWPQFDSTRTDVGEATFQLKYRGKSGKARVLAQALADSICPKLQQLGLIVPMPASNERARQPVNEVAKALGRILDVPVFEKLLVKKRNDKSLKDLHTKEEKLTALKGTIAVNDEIT